MVWMALLFWATALLAGCGGSSTNASIPSPANPGAPAGPIVTPTPLPSGQTPTPSPAPSTQSNLLYVSLGSNQSSEANPRVEAFQLNTGGNIAPVKTITQYQNDMPAPTSIAFDSSGNLYVANINYPGHQGSTDFISIFAPGASGGAPVPIRAIGAGQGSTLGTGMVEGLGLDANGNLYVAVSEATQSNNQADKIFVFSPNANGNVPPAWTIASSACFRIGGMVVLPSGSLVVSCMTSGTPSIETFAQGAIGDATPTSVISGSNTQLTNPGAVAISPLGSIVVLQRTQPGSILTFPQTASGNVAPATDITGSSTQLTGNGGVTVDANGNIYAINTQGFIGATNSSTITEYAPNATGNAAPMNTIAGSNTNLTIGDGGIAIGPP